MAFMTPTSTPATPSRLVSKLCLVGESAVHPSPPANRHATTTATTSTRPLPGVAAAELDDQTPGAVFQLFAKVSVPLLPGSRCYPLFPDTNIHLRSSQVAALTPSSHLPISPTTHPLLATAASRLHIQTITGAASSAASSRQRAGQQQPAVQVAVQDFAVCLLVDGGDGTGGGLSGSNSSAASNVPPSAFTSASSRRLSTSSSRRLSTGHDDASTSFYIVVLELFVPCATIPPLDCYSVSLPLPRCLSNTLVFRISDADDEDATAEEDEEDWEISTTPRALSSRGRASVAPEDLDGTEENDDDVAMIEGTFQSTPAIEIRWGRAPPPLPPTNDGRSTTTTGRSRLVTLHEARSTLALQLLPSTKENNNGSSTAADVALDFTSYGSVHYPLVEATGYLELQLDLPLEQSFEWLPSSSFSGDDGSPTITTSTGLVHWDFLDSSPPLVESSSTQPPSTPGHPRQQSPSISATPSPPPQPSRHPSSSSSSLLRARLPSALLNANPSGPETSFAFDSAGVLGSPSSSLGGAGGDGGSPTAGRGPRHLGEEGARRKTVAARNMRVSLDLHKVRENRQQATDSTSWWVRVQGVVRLHRRCKDEDGEEGYALPLIALPGGGGSPCRVTVVGVDGSEVAEAGWRVVVPEKIVSVVEEATTTKGKGSVSRSGSSTTTTIVDILTPSTSQLRDAENEGRSHYFLLRPPSPPVVQTSPPALSVSSSSSFASSASLGPAPTPSVKAVRRKTHTRDLFDPPTPSSPIHGKTRRRSSILASPPLHQQNQPPALSSTLTMKPTADTFLPSRALSKVSLDVFLVPARALSSADTAIIKGRKDGGNDSDAAPSMGWDQLSVLRVVLPPRHSQEGESDGEDDLEFAISLPQASTFALEPSHRLKALSASWDGKAVGCGVVDPSTDGEEEREEGEEEEGVKYVRVMGDGGGGGVVEVRWVLEHVGASGSKEEERQGLGVGIPSFAEGVLWQEVKVEVGEGHGLSLLSSSAPSRPSTSPSSTSSALQTTTHSLPPLHTPHLRVLVCPVAPLSTSDKDRSSSSIRGFFSVYNLPLILLAILIASMGAEVREFRTSLTQLATHLHGSTRLLTGAVGALERSVVEEVSRGILARLDEAPALAIAPAPLEAVVVTTSEAEAPTAVVRDERGGGGGETEPHVDSIPEEIDTDSPILRPSFSSLPYNPPPPPPPHILMPHQPPPWRTGAGGEMQPVHSSHGTDERLVEAFRTAMRALEPLVRVVGRAMEVVGRVWGWVVW